eukprot:Gb_36791 [translate_table: standard]
MPTKVKLLSSWVSYFGMRVQIALKEKSIPYEYQDENFFNKTPLLLKMNPIHKKVPVLIHNDHPESESLIILQYIDEAWPSHDKHLLPSNPYDRATERFWADFIDKKFYDAGSRILRTKGETQEGAKRDLIENMVILEGALGAKPYFGGETFGFLDIVFIPFSSWFYAYETVGNFKIPLEEKCPNIGAWVKRCMERESVNKVLPHPHKVLEFVLEVRKKFNYN